MVAVTETPSESRRSVTLRDISWETYEALLNDIGERPSRMIYDGGVLEIMPPVSIFHESDGQFIARMIELYSLETDLPIIGLGKATWKRRDLLKGLEADECYYVQHAPAIGARRDISIEVDPPPDLAVEIDQSYVDIDKLAVYASLGVPEVWRFKTARLVIYSPDKSGKHRELPVSLALPKLLPAVVEKFVAMRNSIGEHEAIKAFRDWVRQSA